MSKRVEIAAHLGYSCHRSSWDEVEIDRLLEIDRNYGELCLYKEYFKKRLPFKGLCDLGVDVRVEEDLLVIRVPVDLVKGLLC